MELKYSEDISWEDLPRIRKPSIARNDIESDLDSPYPQITYSISDETFDKIYDKNTRYVNESELEELFDSLELGEIFLVRQDRIETFAPLFIWREDEKRKDKGYWEIDNSFGEYGSSSFEFFSNTVKKPRSSGGSRQKQGNDLFPGANMADTRRAVANAGIESVNTLSDSARKRELAEYADKYPQLQSNASNPLEIDKLKYDNKPYGEFAGVIAGATLGMVGTKKLPESLFEKKKVDITKQKITTKNDTDSSIGQNKVESFSTNFAFEGKTYSEEKLGQLGKYLEKRGVTIMETKGNPSFTGNWNGTGVMRLPAKPTELQVKHELSHFIDFKNQIKLAPNVREGVQNYVDLGRLGREQSVLHRLQHNRVWSQLNDAEKSFSTNYVERLRIEAGQ